MIYIRCAAIWRRIYAFTIVVGGKEGAKNSRRCSAYALCGCVVTWLAVIWPHFALQLHIFTVWLSYVEYIFASNQKYQVKHSKVIGQLSIFCAYVEYGVHIWSVSHTNKVRAPFSVPSAKNFLPPANCDLEIFSTWAAGTCTFHRCGSTWPKNARSNKRTRKHKQPKTHMPPQRFSVQQHCKTTLHHLKTALGHCNNTKPMQWNRCLLALF